VTLPRGDYPAQGLASFDDPRRGRPAHELTAADFLETRWSEYRERQRAAGDRHEASRRALGPEGQSDWHDGPAAGDADSAPDQSGAYSSLGDDRQPPSYDSWGSYDLGLHSGEPYGTSSTGTPSADTSPTDTSSRDTTSPGVYGADSHAEGDWSTDPWSSPPYARPAGYATDDWSESSYDAYRALAPETRAHDVPVSSAWDAAPLTTEENGYSSSGYSSAGYAGGTYSSDSSSTGDYSTGTYSTDGHSAGTYSNDTYPGSNDSSAYSSGSWTGDGYSDAGHSTDGYSGERYPDAGETAAGYAGSADNATAPYPYPSSHPTSGASSPTGESSAQGYPLAPETRAHDTVPYPGYQAGGGAEAYLAPETRAHEVPATPYGGYSTDYPTAHQSEAGSGHQTQYSGDYAGQYSSEYPSQYSSGYPSQYYGDPSAQYSNEYPSQYSGDYSAQYSSDNPLPYSNGSAAQDPTEHSTQAYFLAPETRAHEALPYPGYAPASGAEAYLAPETRAHEVPGSSYEGYSTDYASRDATGYPTDNRTDYQTQYGVEYPVEDSSQAYSLAPETRAHGAVPYSGYLSGSASEAYALAPETRAHDAVPYPDYQLGSVTEAYAPALAPAESDPYAYPLDDPGYPYSDRPQDPATDLDADGDDEPPSETRRGSRRQGGGRGDGGATSAPGRRRGVIAGLTVLVLLAGLGGAAYLKLSGNFNRLSLSGALGDQGSGVGAASHSAMNILVLGSDTRTGIGPTGSSTATAAGAGNADTSLLVHLSADRRSVTVVSIPRDSMVQAPRDCKDPNSTTADGAIRQWNANFNRGGPACTIRAFEGNTSINVDHFVVVDFGGFQKVVDALGGVDVCTPAAIHDKDGLLDLAAGRNHLDGKQALGYVRIRKSLGDGSDLGRIKRQQAFLSSIAQEATSSSLLKRPDKLYRFLLTATSAMTVDSGLNVGALKDLALSIKNVGLENVQFVSVPTEPYPLNPNRVQWTSAADQLWAAIRDDAPLPGTKAAAARGVGQTAPSSADLTVSPADIRLRLVNDSGVSGLARTSADPLQVQGFKIESWVSGKTGSVNGVEVRYGPSQAEAAKTVAAAFPGAKLVASPVLGTVIEVHLGAGASRVVEVPNRLGTQPLPKPSITAPAAPKATATFKPRTAAQDICK
jgi:LCP family protein required for cell wall assembly